jgi:hypothetical protein
MMIGIKPWGSNQNKAPTMPSEWPEIELPVADEDCETFFDTHPAEDGWQLITEEQLSQIKLGCIEAYQTHLHIVSNDSKNESAQRYISRIINNARAFGQQLMDDFGARNVMHGYNEATIIEISNRLAPVQNAIQSGSLKAAKTLLMGIDCTDFMTADEKAQWIQKIDNYLRGA